MITTAPVGLASADGSVTVDMSVLGLDGATPAMPPSLATGYTGSLLPPPGRVVSSQFHAPPSLSGEMFETVVIAAPAKRTTPAAAPMTPLQPAPQPKPSVVAAKKPVEVARAATETTDDDFIALPVASNVVAPDFSSPEPVADAAPEPLTPMKPLVPTTQKRVEPVAPPKPVKTAEPSAPPAPKVATTTPVTTAPPPAPVKVDVPAPVKTVAAKPAEIKKEAPQTASLPPADTENFSIPFDDVSSKVPSAFTQRLDAVAKAVRLDRRARIQLQAYAGGGDLSPSRARRLSLSRALAVRSYLIGKGIRSTRIDVRALGNKSANGDPNRVDLSFKGR